MIGPLWLVEDTQADDHVPEAASSPAKPLTVSVPRSARHDAWSATGGTIVSTRITSSRSDSAPSSRAGTLASSQSSPE